MKSKTRLIDLSFGSSTLIFLSFEVRPIEKLESDSYRSGCNAGLRKVVGHNL